MKSCIRKIGILGGTVDPIHIGHLIMAEGIREAFGLDKIFFVPSGNPPHKKFRTVTDAEHRYNMVCKALSDNPYFDVSRIEINRKGYTYTIDTLKYLREQKASDAKFSYIIGADVLFDLLTWKNYKEVFAVCEFIAALRPGGESEKFSKQIKYLEDTFSAKIMGADIPLMDISSTAIRKRIKEGKSVKYMVPEDVNVYIKRNRLYV